MFLSESRDRLSSMQALSGSGGNISLAAASSSGTDSVRYGESSAPPSSMPLSASTMASGSKRVMALRHEFARHGKSRTVSETDLNYGRGGATLGVVTSSTGSSSPGTSQSGGFLRTAATGECVLIECRQVGVTRLLFIVLVLECEGLCRLIA